jgi:hypothetical protein
MNTASTILKKDLRLKLASLAAIVVLTFVGGMLLGRSKSGDSKVEVAGDRSAAEPAKPAVAAPAAAPPAEAPAAVAQPANPPPAAPVAAPVAKPPEAVAVDPAAAASADAQALRKHRARRPNPVAKDDVMAKVSAPKPAARPAAGFPPPAPAAKVAAKPASGGGGGKKKAAWHDPFAD